METPIQRILMLGAGFDGHTRFRAYRQKRVATVICRSRPGEEVRAIHRSLRLCSTKTTLAFGTIYDHIGMLFSIVRHET
jgi:hypothetical protein